MSVPEASTWPGRDWVSVCTAGFYDGMHAFVPWLLPQCLTRSRQSENTTVSHQPAALHADVIPHPLLLLPVRLSLAGDGSQKLVVSPFPRPEAALS